MYRRYLRTLALDIGRSARNIASKWFEIASEPFELSRCTTGDISFLRIGAIWWKKRVFRFFSVFLPLLRSKISHFWPIYRSVHHLSRRIHHVDRAQNLRPCFLNNLPPPVFSFFRFFASFFRNLDFTKKYVVFAGYATTYLLRVICA